MPLHCPHCDTDQPETTQTCLSCGTALNQEPTNLSPSVPQSATEVWYGNWRPATFSFVPLEADPPPSKTRSLLWKIPVALALLTALVLALLVGVPQYAAKSAAPNAQPPTATAKPALVTPHLPLPAVTFPAPLVMPLTVTLRINSIQHALVVGKPVTISVISVLPPGHSATMTVFYRHDLGGKQTLALTQGSLCRTTWVPTQAGRYVFTATALDDQRRVAAAPMMVLHVAAPPRMPGIPAIIKNAPLKNAQLLPLKLDKMAVHPFAPVQSIARLPVVRRSMARRAMLAHLPPVLPQPVRYHVAAATFPYARNAVVLANALRTRGFPAVVRKGKNGHGQPAYVVQTGVFPRQAAAHQQALHLQQDGYPAFTYTNP